MADYFQVNFDSFTGENRRIMNRLYDLLDPIVDDEKAFPRISGDTVTGGAVSSRLIARRWLESMVDVFRRETGGTRSMVIMGEPGSGRTTFMSELAYKDPCVMAALFLQWQRPEYDNPHRLVRTLAYRLAERMPAFRRQVLAALEDGVKLEDQAASDLFRRLIVQPLKTIDQEGAVKEPFMILIDGMDEVTESGNAMVRYTQDNAGDLPRSVCFVFTARKTPRTESMFFEAERIGLDTERTEQIRDLKDYVAATSQEPGYLTAEDVYNAAEKCEDNFLYAAYMADILKSGLVTDVRKMKKKLDWIYTVLFERAFSDAAGFEACRLALQMLCAHGMMPVEILKAASRLSDIGLLEEKLGSLLQTVSSASGTAYIRLSYKSLADWLMDKDRSGEFYCDEVEGAKILGKFAIRILEQEDLSEIERLLQGDSGDRFTEDETAYLRKNLGDIMAEGFQREAYFEFLDRRDTFDPELWSRYAWIAMGGMTPSLVEKLGVYLNKEARKRQKGAGLSELQYTVLLRTMKGLISGINKQKGADGFARFMEIEPDLPAYLRSADSDGDGQAESPVSEKLDLLEAFMLCLHECRIKKLKLPEGMAAYACAMRLSALYQGGQADPAGAVDRLSAYPIVIRRDVCSLADEEVEGLAAEWGANADVIRNLRDIYNTSCMIDHFLQPGSKDGDYVNTLISFGADKDEAVRIAGQVLKGGMVSHFKVSGNAGRIANELQRYLEHPENFLK
ncbi:MAG: ATP-binding protein [Lachnospiraceae bacterium]